MEISNRYCDREKIAAYVDGQLETSANAQFEAHVAVCGPCRTELNTQRRLICALDCALSGAADPPIPENFARLVSARAVSDMRGLRNGSEPRRALLFCAALSSAAFTLLGTTTGWGLLTSGRLLANQVLGILGLLWTSLRDAVIGLAIISRVVGRLFLPESSLAGVAALVLLLLAVASLSRLIVSYHRRNQIGLFE